MFYAIGGTFMIRIKFSARGKPNYMTIVDGNISGSAYGAIKNSNGLS